MEDQKFWKYVALFFIAFFYVSLYLGISGIPQPETQPLIQTSMELSSAEQSQEAASEKIEVAGSSCGEGNAPEVASSENTETIQAASQEAHEQVEQQEVMIDIKDDDPWFGSPNPKVLIVAFTDYKCGYCKKFAEDTLKKIREQYPDDVMFVLRDYPILTQDSVNAALAANCVIEQNRDLFWKYHDTLFANQGSLGVDSLKKYAKDLGLNPEQFDKCLDEQKYMEELRNDVFHGQIFGVQGTPASIVNGVFVRGAVPFDEYKQIIDSFLDQYESQNA